MKCLFEPNALFFLIVHDKSLMVLLKYMFIFSFLLFEGARAEQNMNALSGILSQSTQNNLQCKNMGNADECMLCNCYHEARGETDDGRLAVMRVTRDRAYNSAYPNSICGVVKEVRAGSTAAQFSWFHDENKLNISLDSEGLELCKSTLTRLVNSNPAYLGLDYHTTSVEPYWNDFCRGRTVIGNHVFYSQCVKPHRVQESDGSINFNRIAPEVRSSPRPRARPEAGGSIE